MMTVFSHKNNSFGCGSTWKHRCTMLLAVILSAGGWHQSAAGADSCPCVPCPIAHRGMCLEAPENTLVAFRMALEAGFGFELDVWMSADGVPMILHDRTLQRTTNGMGRLGEKTLAELKQLDAGSWFDAKYAGEPLPTLAEALDLVAEYPPVGSPIALHLKQSPPDLIAAVVGMLAERNLFDRTFVFGQTPEQSRAWQQADRRVNVVFIDSADRRDYRDDRVWKELLADPDCDGIWLHWVPSAEQAALARTAGKPVYVFSPRQEPDLWRAARDVGAILCCDHVRAICETFCE